MMVWKSFHLFHECLPDSYNVKNDRLICSGMSADVSSNTFKYFEWATYSGGSVRYT